MMTKGLVKTEEGGLVVTHLLKICKDFDFDRQVVNKTFIFFLASEIFMALISSQRKKGGKKKGTVGGQSEKYKK